MKCEMNGGQSSLLLTRRCAVGIIGAFTLGTSGLLGCSTNEPSQDVAEEDTSQESQQRVQEEPSSSSESWTGELPESCACVAEYAGNTVAIIDLDKKEIIGRVSMIQNPSMIVSDADTVYVSASGEGRVYAISKATGATTAIEAGNQPIGMCLNQGVGVLYVCDYFDATIRFVDTKLGSVVNSLRLSASGFQHRTDPPECCRKTPGVGRRPVAMALSPDGSMLYSINYGTYDIACVSLVDEKEIGAYDGVVGPRTVVASKDGRLLIVAGVGGEDEEQVGELYIVDRESGERIDKVPVGLSVADVCLSQDGMLAYAIARDAGDLVLFESQTWKEVSRVSAGNGIESLTLSKDESLVLVANSQLGIVTAFDSATLEKAFEIEGLANPKDIACV